MDARIAATVPIMLLSLIGCSPDGSPRMGPATNPENPVEPTEATRPPRQDPIAFAGTVHRTNPEGVYVIRTADGTQYQPKELPEEYRKEGLAVDVKALVNDDVLTTDMAGKAIDLVEIRIREPAAS